MGTRKFCPKIAMSVQTPCVWLSGGPVGERSGGKRQAWFTGVPADIPTAAAGCDPLVAYKSINGSRLTFIK